MHSDKTRSRLILLILGLALVLALGLSAYRARVGSGPADTNERYVRFSPRTCEGQTGKIVVPYHGESALFTTEGDPDNPRRTVQFDSKNGTFVVPAGTHKLSVFYAYARSGGQVTWSARSTPRVSKVSVKPGQTVSLDVGPPFTASVEVPQIEGKYFYTSLNFTGRGGEDVQIQRVVGTAKEPGFQMLSPSGKVLMQGTFRYG
jgi:hypothetical protein